MARGAHRARKLARDARSLDQRWESLQSQLTEERARTAAAEELQVRRDALAERLRQVLEQRTTMLAGQVLELQQEAAELRRTKDRVVAVTSAASDQRERCLKGFVDLLGGGRQGMEKYFELATGTAAYIFNDRPSKAVTAARANHLESLRERRPQAPNAPAAKPRPTPGLERARRLGRPVLVGAWRHTNDLDGVAPAISALPTPERERLAERAARAAGTPVRATRLDDALVCWYPVLPLIDWDVHDPFADLPQDFGALDARTAAVGTRSTAAHTRMSSHADEKARRRDAAVSAAVGRLDEPWRPAPRFARPGDAVLLRNQYALSARAAWLRTAEDRVPDTLSADDESTWAPPPDALTATLADTAEAVRLAVPFWLPPAQTFGFIDSEPQSEDALADVRLPFPAVLLTFAEPLLLEPAEPGVPHVTFTRAMAALRTSTTDQTPTQLTVRAAHEHWDAPATVDSLLREHGGRVEALLLLADGEGHLRDEFAWCIAVAGAGHNLVAARITVPARRSLASAAHGAAVANAAAVAAWGGWHAPDEELELADDASDGAALAQDHRFLQLEPRGGAGGVRVLNMRRTTGSESHVETGRVVAPHLRRGHWRRQHHGPRRTLVKRVWVAPVLVNAGRYDDVSPRVYRLPLAATVEQTHLSGGACPRPESADQSSGRAAPSRSGESWRV